MDLIFSEFVRKPFVVEAVEVTLDNIADIANIVGVLRMKDDGTPYIVVDRRVVENVYRAYAGFWMTRMGDNVRLYSKKIFNDQFTPSTTTVKEGLGYFKVPA